MAIVKFHELDDYAYHKLQRFENLADNKLTHVDKIRYDDDSEEIILICTMEITDYREQTISNQLSNIAGELNFSVKITKIEDEKMWVNLPSEFEEY